MRGWTTIFVCALGSACGRIDFEAVGTREPVIATFGETGATTFAQVTRDTSLDATMPDLNFGAAGNIRADSDEVGLLRFDLSALPPTTTVISASLRLVTQNDSSAQMIQIERVLEDWTEGSLLGEPGVANHLERMADVPWSAVFRDPTPLGSVQPVAVQTAYVAELSPASIQAWIADPTTNFGLALVTSQDDGVSFASSTAGMVPTRPVLTVIYIE